MTFTGNLDHKIYTNPFYFGTENVYLRAQIARITHSTTLVPKGLYKFNEENDREIEDNTPEEGEIVKPTTREMCDIGAWQHYPLSILKQGRLTHKEGKANEGEEDVEPEELQKREVAKDPWEPRLKQISTDKATKGGLPAWVIRSYNVNDSFLEGKSGKCTQNFGVVVVRSLWWPGSYNFYSNERTM